MAAPLRHIMALRALRAARAMATTSTTSSTTSAMSSLPLVVSSRRARGGEDARQGGAPASGVGSTVFARWMRPALRGATATVWTLENETELRRVPLFPEASGKPNAGSGSDKGESCPGRVSGLAIDTRGRLIAASFDDARSGRGAARVARGR